jgi:hypothetical protein
MDIRIPRKVFFSEEKKQKTFTSLSRFYPAARTRTQKFFGSFFQKRTFLLRLSGLPRCTRNKDASQPEKQHRTRKIARQAEMGYQYPEDSQPHHNGNGETAVIDKEAVYFG